MTVWQDLDIKIYQKQLRKIQTEIDTMSREDYKVYQQWGAIGDRLQRLEKAVSLLASLVLRERNL